MQGYLPASPFLWLNHKTTVAANFAKTRRIMTQKKMCGVAASNRLAGASGKNVFWTVLLFAPQPFIPRNQTHLEGLPCEDYSLLPSLEFF
jgi:hypothetical protein